MPSHFRKLGKDGPMVPAIGFGLMGFGMPIYGATGSHDERLAVLDRAYELGARFWDSSDFYGEADELVGKWLKRTGKRSDIFLATKFGYIKDSPTYEVDTTYAYTKKSCAERLEVLGVEYIDLYYVHDVNPKTPIEEAMRALAELKAEGKIKHIGLSNISSTDLRRAVKIAPVACVQAEYSVFVRDIETERGTNLLAACRELGVAVVAYSPLGRGMLTTTFTSDTPMLESGDWRNVFFPRFLGENRIKNVEIVKQFAALAAKKGCSLPQLALAWLLAQGDDIFAIPGTKKAQYLEDNWGALEVDLSPEEVADLRHFIESAEIAGGLIPPELEARRFATTAPEVK